MYNTQCWKSARAALVLLKWFMFNSLHADLTVSIDDYVENLNATSVAVNSVSISLPPSAFNETDNATIVFSMFKSSKLYPLNNLTFNEFAVASTVVSATIVGREGVIFDDTEIEITLKLDSKVKQFIVWVNCYLHIYIYSQLFQLPVCVIWDRTAAGTYL